MNIRQSSEYSSYMKMIGWNPAVLRNNKVKVFIYIKKIPIFGNIIRIPRISTCLNINKLISDVIKFSPRKILIDFDDDIKIKKVDKILKEKNKFKNANLLSPSKTIQIELLSEKKVYEKIEDVKKRTIKKAIKNNLLIEKSENFKDFLDLKNQQLFPFGFLLSKQIKTIFYSFYSKNKCDILIAKNSSGKKIAGVVILYFDKKAYYWMATATSEGKKLGAPSLLAWEAMRLSVVRKCKLFDFEGIEDTRFSETKSWNGFSHFKKDFGGKEITYPLPYQKLFWPTL